MKNCINKKNVFNFLTLLVAVLLLCMGCPLLIYPEPDYYPLKFSVKNDTRWDLHIKLEVGEILGPQAGYAELVKVPDELYQAINDRWSADAGTTRTVKPRTHDKVYNFLPINGLGTPMENGERERVRQAMLGKLYSFTLTVSNGGGVLYRVVGWDVPDTDMEQYQINEKMCGYFDATKEENYFHQNGALMAAPFFYSKLWKEGYDNPGHPFPANYYIKATGNTFKITFEGSFPYIDDNYWRSH